jgi:hypothetical protein
MQPRDGEMPVPDDLEPLTTPAASSRSSLINDQVFLAFACLEHESMLIAARRMLDRDRAELERRRHGWTWARVGHPPLPIEPLRTGAAAHRLVARLAREQTASRRGDLVTRRSGTQIAPTPARAASASSCGRPSRPGRRQQRWESWPWVRRCPYAGEAEIRWVVLEPS